MRALDVRACGVGLALVAALAAGCGGDGPTGGSGGGGNGEVDVTGTYEGTVLYVKNGAPQDFTIVLTLTHPAGTNGFTGTYTMTGVGFGASQSGQVDGTITSATSAGVTFQQTTGCPGDFAGDVSISEGGDHLEGAFNGSDCDDPSPPSSNVSGTFSVDRQ